MRFGIPLVAGMDPVPLALLDRLAAQAGAELALKGDPRHVEVVRLATENELVTLRGGTRVRPDALFRERPGLDVLVVPGPSDLDHASSRDEETVIAWMREARNDIQHLVATGPGVAWILDAGLASGRRVVLNHLPPTVRARFDAALPAHQDPARDGDLWTASDPLHFTVLLEALFAELGGPELVERIELRAPWLGTVRRAIDPERGRQTTDDDLDDDDDGLRARQDVHP